MNISLTRTNKTIQKIKKTLTKTETIELVGPSEEINPEAAGKIRVKPKR